MSDLDKLIAAVEALTAKRLAESREHDEVRNRVIRLRTGTTHQPT